MRGTSMGGAGRERKGTVQSTQSRNEHRKVPAKQKGGDEKFIYTHTKYQYGRCQRRKGEEGVSCS